MIHQSFKNSIVTPVIRTDNLKYCIESERNVTMRKLSISMAVRVAIVRYLLNQNSFYFLCLGFSFISRLICSPFGLKFSTKMMVSNKQIHTSTTLMNNGPIREICHLHI